MPPPAVPFIVPPVVPALAWACVAPAMPCTAPEPELPAIWAGFVPGLGVAEVPAEPLLVGPGPRLVAPGPETVPPFGVAFLELHAAETASSAHATRQT